MTRRDGPTTTRQLAVPTSLTRRSLVAGATASLLVPAMTLAAQDDATSIRVYPAHGTRTASPGTEITLRGVAAGELGALNVVASQSGAHSGVFVAHSDGGGVSFVPDSPFQPGERVTVRADLPLRASPSGSVSFQVSTPAAPVATPTTREIDQPATPPREFVSRLDLLPPQMTVTDREAGTAPGLVFLGAKIEDGHNGAMILDDDGELVWFWPAPDAVTTHADVRVQEYLGNPVITMWEGIARQGTGFGHLVLLDQGYEEVARVQAGNGYPGIDQHECQLTASGTALVVIYNPVIWDLTPVGGEADGWMLDGVIQEIDIATGRVVFEWHALDHIALDESFGSPASNPEEPWDYVHFNSVEPDADGNLVVSARHSNAIYKIDTGTNRITWRLNGKRSDFAMRSGAPFAYQHDARVHGDGVLSLFDNVSANQDDDAEKDSRGLVLQLDEVAQTATVAMEFIHPSGTLSVSQGNNQILPNGNAFVGWGSAPVFTEFSPEGDVLFNGRFPAGGTTYRAWRFEWTGVPVEPPAIAVVPGMGSQATVYASWNGATSVVRWQVLAGDSPENLELISEVPRIGFETMAEVETAAAWVAVQAIDAGGNIIGASETVEIKR
jgi:hypothetical protein